jgi:hypothetical protein
MRIKTTGALLSVLCCVVSFAQEKPASRVASDRITNQERSPDLGHDAGGLRPLTFNEGLAVLGAALESRHRGNSTSDCSHFVQAIYEQAGFPYTYVNSAELYSGVDEFRRVTSPQPGDLAVWPGHVGIVVNPAQHSFFSLLRSGRGVETYDSDYWKRRGSPRFFRYVKAKSADFSALAETASLKPAALGTSSQGPTANLLPNESRQASSPVRSERIVEPILLATVFVPVMNSAKPKPDDLLTPILKSFAESEQALRGVDLFHLTRPLTVFDQFDVKSVKIKGNEGWAEVQIHEVASLAPSGAKAKKVSERQRWPLRRRDKGGWELTLPQGTIYLPQDVAVRMLAHELASLADASPHTAVANDQKAQLARLLNSLLEK